MGIYSSNVEATKITTDWYLWMHHTTDIIPNKDDINKKKYNWQKDHQENQTGTQNSHKPIKIKKRKDQQKI